MSGGLAILNGFGRTLGDSIIGLQALDTARELGLAPARSVLFRLPGLPPLIRQAYEAAEFTEIRDLPWDDALPGRPFAPAQGFDRVLDIRDFAFDPAFRGVAMIDYFLCKLGADPISVPASRKRNAWLAPRIALPPAGVKPPYVLLCPCTANAMRTMPSPVHDHVLQWLQARAGMQVLTQATLPPAETLAELCALVACASMIVSADTAMVHLADAFAVPCLAFFTTHRPEWRVRDYRLCRAVHLPAPGLPPALEFDRGPADIAAAGQAWGGPDFTRLEQAMAQFLAERK
jgi:hypothetical protein